MLLGCLSGSYSTIFIAAPVLYLFEGQGAATARTKGTPYSRAAARA
jgi:preprotein translocase subunit SecF